MYEISFELETDAYGLIEPTLLALGATSITHSDGDCEMFDEPGIPNIKSWTNSVVRVLFESVQSSALAATELRKLKGLNNIVETKITASGWLDRWKSSWVPMRFSGGLCVCPSWLEAPADVRYLLTIDPGQAFGTGTHETTALCLNWLGSHVSLSNFTVVDYGCGSGILSMAAALLGAKTVTAIDIDPLALSVSSSNICDNKLEDRVACVSDVVDIPRGADLLIANILMQPLIELESSFAALIKPGGEIVLSGLLRTQVEEIKEVYSNNFRLSSSSEQNGWALLAGVRK